MNVGKVINKKWDKGRKLKTAPEFPKIARSGMTVT